MVPYNFHCIRIYNGAGWGLECSVNYCSVQLTRQSMGWLTPEIKASVLERSLSEIWSHSWDFTWPASDALVYTALGAVPGTLSSIDVDASNAGSQEISRKWSYPESDCSRTPPQCNVLLLVQPITKHIWPATTGWLVHIGCIRASKSLKSSVIVKKKKSSQPGHASCNEVLQPTCAISTNTISLSLSQLIQCIEQLHFVAMCWMEF